MDLDIFYFILYSFCSEDVQRWTKRVNNFNLFHLPMIMASYGEKLNSLPQDLKRYYRDLENVMKKIINANWSTVFNKTCIKNNI